MICFINVTPPKCIHTTQLKQKDVTHDAILLLKNAYTWQSQCTIRAQRDKPYWYLSSCPHETVLMLFIIFCRTLDDHDLPTKQSCYHFQSMKYLIWTQQISGFMIQQIKHQAILLPLPVYVVSYMVSADSKIPDSTNQVPSNLATTSSLCSILYGLSRLQDS